MPILNELELLDEICAASPEAAEMINRAVESGKMIYFIGGCTKVKYGHQETALEAARAMNTKTGDIYDAYECQRPLCGAWHIGHQVTSYAESDDSKKN